MRLVLLCFLLTVLGTCVRAQEISDYTLFRPGVRYLYEVDESVVNAQQYYGMELPASDEPVPTYETIRQSSGSNCYERVNAFAGATVFQGEHALLQLADDTIRIEPLFPVGISWIANENLVGRIDREVTEEVFGRDELVRYLVFSRPDGTMVGEEIRIGENTGLLTAPFFEDLDGGSILKLVGVQNPDIGLQAIDYNDVVDFREGGIYHVKSRTAEDLGNPIVWRWTEAKSEVREVIAEDGGSVSVVRRSDMLSYLRTDDEINFRDSVLRSSVIDTINFSPDNVPVANRQIGEAVFADDPETERTFVIDYSPDACLPALRLEYFGPGFMGDCSFHWASGDVGNQDYYYDGFGGNYGFPSDEIGPPANELLYTESQFCSTGTPLDFADVIAGIGSVRNEVRIKVYPNPVSDRVNITIPGDLGRVDLMVYDAIGRLVDNTSAAIGNRSLDVTNLAVGVYTVVVNNSTGPVARKRLVVR